ncbi:response regulator transcription factor [Geobacter sp. SVR]|uniref:response regulator transcription factor n=1 Tax=Geobacter sp. SVR TaxID=2495594 RepID=UPI00143EFEA3|nr:response regulator [Geobacter sp. SVR]BCS55795.1 hypothetical protein GSVR_41030 [Geobacter sp. SVR]GCF83799.1 hypothetical protein GSbR_03990 [Geobacter sp. SVR]
MNRLDISVLYVDDDLQACTIMANLMRLYVRELHLAHDGQEGLEMYRRHQPDVVVTDFSMPVMDGGEMVRDIRAQQPETSVIFMSAHDDAWLAEQLKDVGLTRHITKPVEVTGLIGMLREIAAA